MSPKTPTTTSPTHTYNVTAAMDYLHIKQRPQFQKLIQDGRLHGIKEPITPGSITVRWMFSKEDLDNYLATKGTRKGSTQHPGTTPGKVYLTPEQWATFRATFPGVKVEKTYNYNPTKAKEYRIKRAAARKANNQAKA